MNGRAWAAFGAVAVLWGVPYFFIKVAVDEMPPAFVAWGRVAIAAVILVPIAYKRGALHGLASRGKAVAAYAALEIAIPFTLISIGEQWVSSSLTAILIASMPLIVAVLTLRFDPDDRPGGRRLAGLVIGLGGVILLFGVDVAGDTDEVVGAACILVATFCYASATMVVRKGLSDLPPLGPVAAGLAISTVALAPAVVANPPSDAPSAEAIASVVALGVLCTALALVLFFVVIAEAGPSRASVITYVNPAVAVLLGVAILGESLTAAAIAGLLLILAGSWLSTGGRMPPGLGARRRRKATEGLPAASP